jgi:membrane associated rhomboid family serine protease
MPDLRKKAERNRGRNPLLKNRVVDLKAFRRHKNAKSRETRKWSYRSVLYWIAIILVFLSIACGILGMIIIPFRAQFVIFAIFLAVIGLVTGLALSALLDRRARKVMGYLCIGLLIAFVAGVAKLGF